MYRTLSLRSIALCLFIFLPFLLSAQSVSRSEAETIAKGFFLRLQQSSLVKSVDITAGKDSIPPLFYVFSGEKGGFLILAGDRRAYPVLAWADSGFIREDPALWPPSFREWLASRSEEINYITESNLPSSSLAEETWKKLDKGETPVMAMTKDVAPLLATTWNQGCGYNALCPADPAGACGHAYTGCVATAMAQVIRYMEHPVSGTGNKCYTHYKYGELCADFSDGIYDYASMTNNSGNAAVARLMYHCGVSVSMNYGTSGSSAFSSSVATAMRRYFDYTNGLIIGKGSYTENAWERILRNELDNSRPLYYSGHGTGGHAFVLDGYKNTNHFHVNWGWGGSYNGYFYLSSLNPGSMSFSSGQQAIVGMVPAGDFTGLDGSAAIELNCQTPVEGDIAAGTNLVNYYKNYYPAAVGKEILYRFTTLLPGRIRIKISNQSDPVYTFLLSHPHQDSLVAYGSDGLTLDNTEPGTWYLAVEGMYGQEPTFTLEVICPTTDPDLDIRTANVSPRYLESLQNNVGLSSMVRNIGHSASTSCTMEYYLSTDRVFDPGTDLYLGNKAIPALEAGAETQISSFLNMPDGLLPGSYQLVFVADRENLVPEADDENLFFIFVTVPEPGLLDCSTALALEDEVWLHGNTLLQGSNSIEEYNMGWEMTGPEVIHTFVPEYNGMANIHFVEKSPGRMQAMLLSICNEQAAETSLMIWNPLDTTGITGFYVTSGTEYFLVVDGYQGASGDYSLMVELPERCPEIILDSWGKTSLCEGDSWPGFWTFWGHSNYQWFMDGSALPEATGSSYSPKAPGDYHLEITENGCTASSPVISVRMDALPDTVSIRAAGDLQFCPGEETVLELENPTSWSLQWARDGEELQGETGESLVTGTPGSYSVMTVNGACRLPSKNSLEIKNFPYIATPGERLPLPSDTVAFYFPFTSGNHDESGNNLVLSGWDYEPVNDRSGNFWQARFLPGNNEMFYISDFDTIPGTFTLAMWFKTSSDSGGVLAGFYDNPWGPVQMEALVYLSNDGKLHFWVSNQGAPAELSTIHSYNDGQWHFFRVHHNGRLLLETDNGKEKLETSAEVVKESFPGYWVFGGPAVPAGVSSAPASGYYRGCIDELLGLHEENPFIARFMTVDPVLEISLVGNDTLCNSGTVVFNLHNSQPGIEYLLRNATLDMVIPPAVIGNGESISIGEGTETGQSSSFEIIARNPLTLCEKSFNLFPRVSVFPVEVPSLSIDSDAREPLCSGTTVHFSSTATGTGENPLFEWWVNGAKQGTSLDHFSLEVPLGITEIYAALVSGNPCATENRVISDTIVLTAEVCTGVARNLKETWKVYPQPAGEVLWFETNISCQELSIFNALGKCVFSSGRWETLLEVPLHGWTSGIYFYRVFTENGTLKTGRIVVK